MKTLAVFAIQLLLAGCASSPNSSRSGFDETPITREQILQSGASSLYEVVRRLRPGWLPRGYDRTIIIADDNYHELSRINSGDNLDMMARDSEFLKPGGTENVLRLEWIDAAETYLMLRSWANGAIIICYRPGGGG